MNDKNGSKRYRNYGSSKHSTTALDRLRNNLSPVTSYYKPLMRTFGKRDDSPKVSKTKEFKKKNNFKIFKLKEKVKGKKNPSNQ